MEKVNFNYEIFLYNYLRYIYPLMYRENPGDGNLLWGFENASYQKCVGVITTGDCYEEESESLVKECLSRICAEVQLILSETAVIRQLLKGNGFQRTGSKFIFCNLEKNERRRVKKTTQQFVFQDGLEYLLNSAQGNKDSMQPTFMEGVLAELRPMILKSTLQIAIVSELISGSYLGIIVISPMRDFTIIEIIGDCYHVIEELLSVKKIKPASVLLIAGDLLKKINNYTCCGEIVFYSKKVNPIGIPSFPKVAYAAVLKIKVNI